MPRALGKWRGSTIAGYLGHDDTTYKENFRCGQQLFASFSASCRNSKFVTAHEMNPVWVAAQLAGKSKAYRQWHAAVRKMVQVLDPPNFRFKLGVCLYAMGQGGRVKQIADAASVGVSTVRGWLEQLTTVVPRK